MPPRLRLIRFHASTDWEHACPAGFDLGCYLLDCDPADFERFEMRR